MKRLIAALTAAFAVSFAYAQDPAAAPVPKEPANLVAEPNASAFRADGPEVERVKPIVDALNAEASLKFSKITVSPELDVIYLTGVTVSDAQRKRAMEIVTSHAGEGKVVNAITTDQLIIAPVTITPAVS